MEICKYCGGEIIFRHTDGAVRPFHLSGRCAGEAESGPRSEAVIFKHERDFCRPARCPKCEAEVFFIRHNGGSVWVNDLGWPWPKHPCFDSMPEAAPLRILHEAASHLQGAIGAVVTRVYYIQDARGCIAAITNPGAKRELWIVRDIQDPRKLLGALVAVSYAGRKLVLPGGAAYDIEEPKFPCPVCKTLFFQSQLDQHLAEKHGVAICPTCQILIKCSAFDAHLRDHERNACLHGHGPLRMWEGSLRCWTCGWPTK